MSNQFKLTSTSIIEYHDIPIIPLVVVGNQSAIIKTTHPKVLQYVCKVDNLKNKITNLTSSYTVDILTEKDFKKTSKLLLKDDTPHIPTIEKTHGLSTIDIRRGVWCSNWLTYHMIRKDRVWVCPRCFYSSPLWIISYL
jgi:hypothetical protein